MASDLSFLYKLALRRKFLHKNSKLFIIYRKRNLKKQQGKQKLALSNEIICFNNNSSKKEKISQ